MDKAGCVSFQGQLYEVGIAYIGRKVNIRYDPSWTQELEVIYEQTEPFIAKKLVIGANCGLTNELPEHMKSIEPRTSRMLDALKKERESRHQPSEIATAFKAFWEEG
jgi:hypothetical protein